MELVLEVIGIILIFILSSYKGNYLETVLIQGVVPEKTVFQKINGWLYSLGYVLVIFILHSLLGLSYEYILLFDLFISMTIVSIVDIKYRIVPNVLNLTILLTQLIIRFVMLQSQVDILNLVFSSVVFLFLVIISLCTNEQFGMGDIKFLAIMMIIYGLTFMLYTMLIAMLLVIIVAVPLIICKKISIKTSVPFIPFYCVGVLGYIILNFLWR